MNLALLDWHAVDYPEVLEDSISVGFLPTTLAFNRRGTILSVGYNDGRVLLWDFDTRTVARAIFAHTHPVTSLSWSRNGRSLLSSSTDWTVQHVDVLTGAVLFQLKLDTGIVQAELHPLDSRYCLVSPMFDQPKLVDMQTNKVVDVQAPESDDSSSQKTSNPQKGVKKSLIQNMMCCCFNRQGTLIYTGSPRGTVNAIDMKTLQIVHTFKIPGGVKSICFNRKGTMYLVNSTDKTLRIYDADTNLLVRDFSDLINRVHWRKACFSSNADYLVGGSAQKADHHIFIWQIEYGRLIQILEGPKEGIVDLVWHPQRPIVVSCSNSGGLYIWSPNYTENWSAFAPDFQELEENEEYLEKEDEFDEPPDGRPAFNSGKHGNEDEDVDIMTIEEDGYFSPVEEELIFLPTRPDPDDT